MKKKFLDEEEAEFVKEWEGGDYKPVKITPAKLKKLREAAKVALSKDTQISIRINSSDLAQLQAKAAAKKKRFHTYIGELLHKDAQRAA